MFLIAACATACTRTPSPTPSGLRVPERTGDVHDFDFLAGAWTVHNRTLKPNSDGADAWLEFPSTTCMTLHLGGVMNVEEVQFPTRGYSASALRIFDREKRQWAIYWVESKVGKLLPPVWGGFDGDRGEFYGEDEMAGERVLFRFLWTKLGADRARWEQAYSPDGLAWKVNWVMEFTRRSAADCPRP